jgi:hypothetical protein
MSTMSSDNGTGAERSSRGPGRRKIAIFGIGAAVLEALALKLRANRFAGNVVVRCRQGHLFTTIWIPGASVKSLRLGLLRFQRCPVGHHWSFVVPVKESKLSAGDLRHAHEQKDIRLP